MPISRRTLISSAALAAGSSTLSLPGVAIGDATGSFSISLAQWSLHRTYFGQSWGAEFRTAFSQDPDSVLQGDRDPLDFPSLAREAFDIDAVEYVNTFFFSRARDQAYLTELKKRADDAGVRSLLIMCDALGSTGDEDPGARQQAVENHHPWLDAAAFLGCHAIRVNARGSGDREALSARVAESLNSIAEYAAPLGLKVLVENHGGLSSDAAWLAETIVRADRPNVGTLPDFGNFRVSAADVAPAVHYDRYQGTAELMPYAGAVSAKSYDFDEQGRETSIDYQRMLKIVTDAGYHGYVGVEYEGKRLPEFDGIRATRDLLQNVRDRLAVPQPPSNPS